MGKDLIIGGASNYDWNKLKHWVNSIKKSDFKGDIVLVATNIEKETIEKLTEEGLILELYGDVQEDGSVKSFHNGAPHVERFFYIWNYLTKHGSKYDFVVATDTRDVVFQSNPSDWYDDTIFEGLQDLIVSCEGMKYEDEPWNNQNLLQSFGSYFHKIYKEMKVCNVGILAGSPSQMRDLFFMIFQMSVNRPIPIVDQVVFNIILQQKPYTDIVKTTTNKDAWAINLGITREAVKSGAGDLGATIQNNPSKMIMYETTYLDEQPNITDEGIVVNSRGIPFVIVHQYDRTLAWRDKIEARYDQ